MFRSDDVILVTRDGARAGFFLPWETPERQSSANVVLSVLIGGRARLVIASTHGPRCLGVDAVAVEIARHVPRLAEKRKLDPVVLLAALRVMPIEWKPASVYAEHREHAESRIAARDPADWPTLARGPSRRWWTLLRIGGAGARSASALLASRPPRWGITLSG